ncbi:hypothetical protein WN944_019018 [Citrus x changshan-huyou]|uniref:Uncharacterized protein n=1 Tax=Citrus x changshan-huyou TaxID=2935761 RepID=A0AAP0LUP1_9ROSI
MENEKHPSIPVPLVSRLDHLESIMKDLERKQNLAKWGCNSNNSERQRQHLPLNLAAREAYFKGSLLDRVASLENRLFQLCLELESSSTYGNSTETNISRDASSSQGSKKHVSEFSKNPYQPQKHEPGPQVLATSNSSENQGKYWKKVQQRRKQPSPIKQRGKSKINRDEKTCNGGKTRVSSNWPHLKLLGC